jgi:hypothetical protein
MSDSDFKQVTVALSHPDELNPRRNRRRTRKLKDDGDSQSGGAAPVGEVADTVVSPQATNATFTVQKQDIPVQTITVSSTPGALPVNSTNPVQSVTPAQPAPSMAAVTMVGGATPTPGVVHLREKKNTHAPGITPGIQSAGGLNAPNAPVVAPKIILHKKRLTNAPVAQTLKKPKFVVSVAAPSENLPPLSTPKNDKMPGGAGSGGIDLKPVKGGVGGSMQGLKQRRKFTERRIKIEVKPSIKTRKGILKPKSTAPPESMLRSMLHDYYLLKQSE